MCVNEYEKETLSQYFYTCDMYSKIGSIIILEKKIHLLNFFFLKKMVIEMLLNSDIQKKNRSNDFTFSK